MQVSNISNEYYESNYLGQNNYKNNEGSREITGWTKDGKWRIDVELPKGGKGNIHLQDMRNSAMKFYYRVSDNKFVDKFGNTAPGSIQKLLNNTEIVNAINKGFNQYLIK